MLLRSSSAPSGVINSFLSHVEHTTHDYIVSQCSLSPSNSSLNIQPSLDHINLKVPLHCLMSRAQSQPDLHSCFDNDNYFSSKLSTNEHATSYDLTLDQSRESIKPKLLSLALSSDNNGGGNFDHGFTKTNKDDDDDDEFIIRKNYYQALLKEDPNNPLLLRNYGEFMYKYSTNKENARKCEELYERAILADPNDGEILTRYAEIQWDAHKDRERAEVYYDKAIQSSPDDWYVCMYVYMYELVICFRSTLLYVDTHSITGC